LRFFWGIFMTQKRVDYGIVGISYLSFIALGMQASALGPVWATQMREALGQPLDALGLLLLTTVIGYFIGSSITGRLVARFSIGTLLAGSLMVAGLGFIGYGLLSNWAGILFLGVITGFTTGIQDGTLNVYFAAHFNARLMNWLHASFGIGAFLGPLLVNLVIISLNLSWHEVFYAAGGLYVLISVVFVSFNSRWLPVTHTDEDSGKAKSAPLRSTMRLGIVWLGILTFICYTGAEAGAGSWGSDLFQSRNVDAGSANTWVSWYWGSFTIGRIFFGAIVTRFRAENVIRLCLIGALIGAGLMWWNINNIVSLIGFVGMGFMLAPMFAMMLTTTQERLGTYHAPNAIGLQVAAASFGGGIMPALAGNLSATYSLEIIPPFFMVVLAVMFVVYQLSLSTRFNLNPAQST
jgi:fucose permease